MQVTPYLHFDGNCAEALELYRKALNAKIETVMRFKDAPPSNDPQSKVSPEMLNQVMHSSFRVGDTNIMASDCGKPMQGFSLTVGLESDAEVDRLFNALSAGGQVFQAPQETFFASRFTVFNDPFGVNWILLHDKGQPTERTEPERKIFC